MITIKEASKTKKKKTTDKKQHKRKNATKKEKRAREKKDFVGIRQRRHRHHRRKKRYRHKQPVHRERWVQHLQNIAKKKKNTHTKTPSKDENRITIIMRLTMTTELAGCMKERKKMQERKKKDSGQWRNNGTKQEIKPG